MWPRETHPESLFHATTCPLHTDIAVERDLASGKLLGYHEVGACVGVCSQDFVLFLGVVGELGISFPGCFRNTPTILVYTSLNC